MSLLRARLVRFELRNEVSNEELALVRSGLAKLFVSRESISKKAISATMRPSCSNNKKH